MSDPRIFRTDPRDHALHVSSGDPVAWCLQCSGAPVPIAPDPERDRRVAQRRALDAARAGRALDRLLAADGEVATAGRLRRDGCDGLGCSCCGELQRIRWALGYGESEEHHNGHYGVSLPTGGEMVDTDGTEGYGTPHA